MALTPTEEAQVLALVAQQAAILSLAGNEATITSKLGATKVTLSDLTAAASVSDTDLFLTRQGVADKSLTPLLLSTYMGTALDSRYLNVTGDTATGALDLSAGGTSTLAPASDNTLKIATTSWVWTNIQALVASCIAAVATASGFASSLGATGYIKFPSWLGGWIVQWANPLTTIAGGVVTWTFPITFPTARLMDLAGVASSNCTIQGTTSSSSSRGYALIVANTSAAAGAGVLFSAIAIGY